MQPSSSRQPRPAITTRERLHQFLTERVTEELAQLWARDQDRSHSGLASQLDVVDDILRTLKDGRLPEPCDLVVLLYGYRSHPDYDPAWTAIVEGPPR